MDLTLCLTHDCNLRCGYCYAGRKHRKTMEWEVAKAAIDFSLKESLSEVELGLTEAPSMVLGFFGGEPLLEWELLKRCHAYVHEQADRLGVRVRHTVTTNMTLLDAEKCSWLLENGYYLGLSLDGNEAMHDTWRKYAGGRGSHADCIKALPLLEGHESRAEIVCVVDPANVRHLADSVRWLADATRVNIALNPNFSADWTEEALELLSAQYREMADFYVQRFREGRPIHVNVIDGKIKTHVQGGYQTCDKCSMGEKEVAVSAAGNFYPCARLVGNDDAEDIRFGNVWSGYDTDRRLRLIAERGNRNPVCFVCPVRERCMSWCGCVNYVTSGGDIGMVGPFTCFHEKMSIYVSDSVAEALWSERNADFLWRFYGVTPEALEDAESKEV